MSDMAIGAPVFHGGRVPRWVLVLLVLSLALNLLVLGSVGALMWRVRAASALGGAVAPNLLGYASTLPTERRKELWELSAQERQQVRPYRREVRAARQQTVDALVAERFDRQQFIAAQTRQADAETRAREVVRNLYVTIAEGLTREERQGYAHWRENRRPAVYNMLDEDQKSEERGKR